MSDLLPRLQRLPKAELHVHLDGSLRAATLAELARDCGHVLPVTEPAALERYMHVTDARDLVDYLDRFQITLAVMQTAAALERIAFELAEDTAREGVRYIEVRFCPVLNTHGGMTSHDAVEAALRGLRRAEKDLGIRTALIVCALRNLDPKVSLQMAEVAVDFRDRGVVAFDLAGAENGNPPSEHIQAFQCAADANLPITIHAGEAFGTPSIHEAVHYCHARRIGHGTRLFENPELMRFVNDFRIPLEICLTSNAQTRAVTAISEHPLRLYYDQGMLVTLNTDNRLMSATTVSNEYLLAHTELGFGWDELCELALMSFESAFLPWAEKQALLQQAQAEIAML
ncbi:MAG TPA: adenosine deaminase [Longimicrobiales bacterium]|nr:adenosine deaminase [Longimicrobiales bacterium]